MRCKIFVIAGFALAIFPFLLAAQSDLPLTDFQSTYGAGVQAYQQGNFKGFLHNMQQAVKLRPQNLMLRYNVACGYSLTGQLPQAIHELKQLAEMGLSIQQAATDADLKALREIPDFEAVLSQMQANLKPRNASEVAFRLTEKDLVTESVAYDSVDQAFYISSIHQCKIVKREKNGQIKDFITPNQDGIWSVFGLKVDAVRRKLWACTAVTPQMEGFAEDMIGAGVFVYDLETGKLLQKYLLRDQLADAILGDLTLLKSGEAFVSDSRGNHIFKISAKSTEPELFFTSPEFKSLQGLTLSADERFLFIADYETGLYRLELTPLQLISMQRPETVYTSGIDGLYFFDNSLIAIQNRYQPNRVVRYRLTESGSAILQQKILEQNHADFNEPTLGVVVNRDFFYIANSQWSSFNDDRTMLPADKLTAPTILKIRL